MEQVIALPARPEAAPLAAGESREPGREPFLQLSGIEKTYADGTHAVRGVDLSISRGEFIVLLGPSGCGKTTTLRMIAGLEQATSGAIRLAGQDVTRHPPSRRDVGMVFQFYALYPHLTARDNIGFPLRAAGLPKAEIASRVDAIAARMHLTGLLARLPRQLSGGDQQKIALARAIVRRPAVYLMDEPLGTLDADQRQAMRELIRVEQQASRSTTLYVTHDQEEAMSLADRIVVMEGGRIRQVGAPLAIYDRPADVFVARFVGSPSMNLIPGEVRARSGRSFFVPAGAPIEIPLPSSDRQGPATLGVRGEDLHEDAAGMLVGTLKMDEYLGSASNIYLDTEFGRLLVRSRGTRARARGSVLRLRVDAERASLFDASTGQRW